MSSETMISKTKKPAPFLIIAVGNRSRGDDSLGPLLLEQLQQTEAMSLDVEFLEDYQLQVEHALDLRDRCGVLFIDAALPGIVKQVSLEPIIANQVVLISSHSLCAEAVLYVSTKVNGGEPPSWQLAIEGESFGLGENLSAVAEKHLKLAFDTAREWLTERRYELAKRESLSPGTSSCLKDSDHA